MTMADDGVGQYHGGIPPHHHARADIDGNVAGDDPHHALHHLDLDRRLLLYAFARNDRFEVESMKR